MNNLIVKMIVKAGMFAATKFYRIMALCWFYFLYFVNATLLKPVGGFCSNLLRCIPLLCRWLLRLDILLQPYLTLLIFPLYTLWTQLPLNRLLEFGQILGDEHSYCVDNWKAWRFVATKFDGIMTLLYFVNATRLKVVCRFCSNLPG